MLDNSLVSGQTNLQNCRDFTAPVMIDGEPRQALGQTSQQPDGSWQVTVSTPGLPQEVYQLPPQAIYLYIPQTIGGTPGSTGRCSSAVRSSWSVVFHHHHFHHNGASSHGGASKGGSHHGGISKGRR